MGLNGQPKLTQSNVRIKIVIIIILKLDFEVDLVGLTQIQKQI